MKVLHLLSGGDVGGIETLCHDIARYGSGSHEFCLLFHGGMIADKMTEEGARIHRLYQSPAPVRFMKLYSLMRKGEFDAVVVHHEGTGIYAFYLYLGMLFPGVKFIKYLHCAFDPDHFSGKSGRVHYQFLKKTLDRSDAVIAVSEYVKKSYCDEFECQDRKVHVVYNGIKLSELKKTEKKAEVSAQETVSLLYMGRLVDIKGVDVLLHAVHDLLAEGIKAKLHILGDGGKKTEYQSLADRLGIKDQVSFHGFILDKAPYLQRCDLFVYPSICQEAFGISLVEAMDEGLLCIAAKVGGIPEIITDGQNGILYENDEAGKNLTEALKRAISLSEAARAAMVENGYKRAQDFSINNTIRYLEKIIGE